MNATSCLQALSDDDLLARLRTLVERDGQLTAALLAHLGEVEARKLHLREGCSSLHVYCCEVLHLSEDAAYKRIQAAKAARRFPVLLDRLAAGELHLAAVCLLAPHLTEDNCAELLAAARHQSKRQVEELIAARFPRPDAPDRVRALPAPAPAPAGELAPGQAPAPLVLRAAEPLSADRFKVEFTVDRALHDKLAYAQALLRHQVPDGNLATLVDRAVTLLIADLERVKVGKTAHPRAPATEPEPGAEYVSASVRREVWDRDGAQCSYVSPDGRRCTERGFLEFDHLVPASVGGAPTVAGTRLLCAGHNRYEAERILGEEVVAQGRRRKVDDQVLSALKNLQVSKAAAREALQAARNRVPPDATLEDVLRAALQSLPKVARVIHPTRT